VRDAATETLVEKPESNPPPIAFDEAEFYAANAEGRIRMLEHTDEAHQVRALRATNVARTAFPEPRELWIDSRHEFAAQLAAYRFIAPVSGRVALQLGGSGLHAVKFLLAGASQGWLCSPVEGELRFGLALAEYAGVSDRFRAVNGCGESIPFADGEMDVVYSGGSLHHMDVARAIEEIRRVLRPGGLFSAIDPWAAPGYHLGTRVFGKREPDVHCRPLTTERLKGVASLPGFGLEKYGVLFRYPTIAMDRLGVRVSRRGAWAVADLDERVRRRLPQTTRLASSSVVTYAKPQRP
jgi:SAM-dependent methyltransferase